MSNPYSQPYQQQNIPPQHQQPPYQPQRRHRRRPSCLIGCIAGFIILMFPLFVCALFTLGYLLFPPPPVDILVIGMDSRGSEGAVARTDSIMVINIDGGRRKVSVLSIPRGLFVDVPNYGSQMINTVNFLGEVDNPGTGMALLSQTIEQNFGIEIDHYVRMQFAGFADVINAVGGVEINVEKVIEDYAYPTADGGTISIRFDPGLQWMDGERALIYARTRHGDDDYRRAERQQQVVSAFVRRSINPLTWGGILLTLNRSLESDLNFWDIATTAPMALISGGRFNQLVIDRDYILPGEKGPRPNYDLIAPFIIDNFD